MNKPRIHYLALQVTGSCNVSQNEWIKHNMINGKQITEVVGPPLSLSLSLSLSPLRRSMALGNDTNCT